MLTSRAVTLRLVCAFLLLFALVAGRTQAEQRTLVGTITCDVPPGLDVVVDQTPIAFLIDPDVTSSDQTARTVRVGTNDPPVDSRIAVSSGGKPLTYRLTQLGGTPPAWDAVPVLPDTSGTSLPELGWSDYTLDLRTAVGPEVGAGVYYADVYLRFQISGIFRMAVLPVTTTVLPRSPAVEAGPDQVLNEGNMVEFSGSYSDPDTGETYTIDWDFGDGSAASGSLTATHTYLDDGTYTVSLTVADSNGKVGQDSLTVTVNDLAPTARLETVPPTLPPLIVDAGEALTFSASGSTSSSDAIVSYEWDWDYGGLAFEPSGDTGEQVAHSFDAAGTYTVAVRVIDDDGSMDIAALQVTVASVHTAQASLGGPQAAGGGGGAVEETGDVAIDELYVHGAALRERQFHLVSRQPAEPSTPLVYMPFGEGAGQRARNRVDEDEEREPALEGTLHGAEWIPGERLCGNAFAVSLGTEGYVSIPADPRLEFPWNQDFTFELWVRAADDVKERPLIRRRGSDGEPLYGLELVGGAPFFYLKTGGGESLFVRSHESIADGTWHHVACVREQTELRLYVDGELADEIVPEGHTAPDLLSREPVFVGGIGTGEKPMGGLVDAVYAVGESINLRLSVLDEQGDTIIEARPSVLYVRYGATGRQVGSGFVGYMTYDEDARHYAYALDTSSWSEGIYEFCLVVADDGIQERVRVLVL